jgi:hypothetical protein
MFNLPALRRDMRRWYGDTRVREYLHSVQSHRQVESISEGSTVFTLGLGKRAPMGATYWQYREWGDSDKRHALFEPPQEHDATVKYLYFSAFPRSADPNCSSSAITDHISHEVILYTELHRIATVGSI